MNFLNPLHAVDRAPCKPVIIFVPVARSTVYVITNHSTHTRDVFHSPCVTGRSRRQGGEVRLEKHGEEAVAVFSQRS